jgi:hypothetical protein
LLPVYGLLVAHTVLFSLLKKPFALKDILISSIT